VKNPKSRAKKRNPGLKPKNGKNGTINFVQRRLLMLKPCFLNVSDHADSRKKNINPGKSHPC
jgi:hypothetical protein